MNEQGFIKLSRKYFSHFLWEEDRVYSRAEAWLDLIANARFGPSSELIRGRNIELRRGELPASRRYLQKRWGWGNTRIANFISLLVRQGMIKRHEQKGQTIYTLCNYEQYNTSREDAGRSKHNQGMPPTHPDNDGKDHGNITFIKNEQEDNGNTQPIAAGIRRTGRKNTPQDSGMDFIPPTLDEAAGYCRQNACSVNPELFIDYYTSNGWMVGKNKMKDWKAAIRTWHAKQDKKHNTHGSIPAHNREAPADRQSDFD